MMGAPHRALEVAKNLFLSLYRKMVVCIAKQVKEGIAI
jgi:hypothetical protein